MFELVEGSDPKKISGVVSRGPEGLIFNFDADVIRNIDGLPFPEREKFWGLTEEEKLTVDVSYICSIRGCPYRCYYCASPAHWKRDKTQYRSPSSLVSEMRYVKEKYWNRKRDYDYSASANAKSKNELIIEDNSAVYFVDDIFTVHPQRIKEILRLMIDQNLGMKWKCEARTDHLDEEICQLMAKAGCIRVKLGFESGSDRILKRMNRTYSRDHFIELAHRIRKILPGEGISTDIIVGFPGETEFEFSDTLTVMEEVKFDSAFNFKYSPRPGTKASEYDDPIPEDIKQQRLEQIIALQKRHTLERNLDLVGTIQGVLIEKESKMSSHQWAGRTDSNKWVIFDKEDVQIKDMVSIQIKKAKGITLHGEVLKQAEAA